MSFENWEVDHKSTSMRIIVIALIAIVATASVAYAAIKITSPASDPVTVTDPSSITLSKPTVNATQAYIGETIQVTTTLSTSKEGLQVFFYCNDVAIGNAYTDSQGQAIFNHKLNAAGTNIYTADVVYT